MPAESVLKQVVARLQAALLDRDYGEAPDTYRIRGYDIGVLFETIRRYGGRKDWLPTEPNIEALPGPVQRHVRDQQIEINRLHRELIRQASETRRLERIVQAYRHPPR